MKIGFFVDVRRAEGPRRGGKIRSAGAMFAFSLRCRRTASLDPVKKPLRDA